MSESTENADEDEVVAGYAAWMDAAFEAADGPARFAQLLKAKAAERLEAVRIQASADGDLERAAKAERDLQDWRHYTFPSGTRSSWRPTRTRPRPTVPPKQLRSFFAAVVVELVPTHPTSPVAFPDFTTLMQAYVHLQTGRVGRPPSKALGEPLTRRFDTGDTWSAYQRLTQEALERLPDYFPDHLTVDGFADLGRTGEVGDSGLLGADRPGLYSDFTPYGTQEPALELLDRERRVMLLGDPGCGKSTLLQGLGLRTIRDGLGLAVFARLDDVGRTAAASGVRSAQAAATAIVTAWLNWLKQEPDAAVVAELARQFLSNDHPVVVTLDGLDEVSRPEYYQGVVDVLRHVDELDVQLVLSSRITGYSKPLAGLAEHVVLRLDHDGPRHLIEAWFRDDPSGRGKASALSAIEDPQLADIARNQLIAGFICFVAEAERVATTKHGLYRQYLHQFLTRRWKEPSSQRTVPEVDVALAAARQAAWTMATRQLTGGHPVWLDTAKLGWLVAASASTRDTLLDLYLTDGLLVAFGPADDTDPMTQPVRWLHRTVHEHLTGRELALRLLDDQSRAREILQQALLRPVWEVPLEHCAGALAELGTLNAIGEDLWLDATRWDTLGRHRTRAVCQLLGQGRSQHLVTERRQFLIREGAWDLVSALASDLDPGDMTHLLEQAVAPLTQKSGSHLEQLKWILGRLVKDGRLSWQQAEQIEERLSSRLPNFDGLSKREGWRSLASSASGFADWVSAQLDLPREQRAWVWSPPTVQSVDDRLVRRFLNLLEDVGTVPDWGRELQWLGQLIRDEHHATIFDAVRQVGVAPTFLVEFARFCLTGEVFEPDNVDDGDLVAVLRGDLGAPTALETAVLVTERNGRDIVDASRWGLLGSRMAREPWNTSRPQQLLPLPRRDLVQPGGSRSFDRWTTDIDAAEHLLDVMETVHNDPTTAAIADLFRRMGETQRPDEPAADDVWQMDASWYTGFVNSLPPTELMEAGLALHDELTTEQWSHLAGAAVDSAYRKDPAAGLGLLSTYFRTLVSRPAERDVFRRLSLWPIADWSHDDAVEAARRALESASSTHDEVWRIELTVWAEERLHNADALVRHVASPFPDGGL